LANHPLEIWEEVMTALAFYALGIVTIPTVLCAAFFTATLLLRFRERGQHITFD
jgi:hypothetical protein